MEDDFLMHINNYVGMERYYCPDMDICYRQCIKLTHCMERLDIKNHTLMFNETRNF